MLQVLHLEDSAKDAAIIAVHLQRAGIRAEFTRVETEDSFLSALKSKCYSLILADYHLPTIKGDTALQLAHQLCPDTPFIFVSGAIGEEVAVEMLKSGATDYVLKDRLLRLVPCIERALNEAKIKSAVTESRRELQLITDTVGACLARCSADSRYLWVNNAYSNLIGKPISQIAGKRIPEILGEDGFKSIQEQIKLVLAGHRTEYEVEIDYPSAGKIWVHVIYTPTRRQDGSVDGWVASIIDISALKRAEQELKDADRRKDEFLAMLSHELRNPLAPIRTGIHLLKDLEPNSSQWERLRGMLDRQVNHISRIVDDLLDVSRLRSGKIVLRRDYVDLVPLLREVIADHESIAGNRDVTVIFNTECGHATVLGDSTRLIQTVGNLIQNAVKFSKPQSRVTVSLAVSDSSATITVTDEGIGIDSDLLPRLFQPFSQAPQLSDRTQGGLGLGLALSKGLVHLHGGSITAASAGPGRGSKFTVVLPLAEKPESQPVTTSADVARRALRVLLIEDNSDAAESIRMLLELAGHEVRTAQSGREGLELFKAWAPNVVLCDIGLPDMDGYTICREMIASKTNGNVRYIALTGYGQESDIQHAEDAGFDLHLTKPVDPDKLDLVLQRMT